MSEQNPITNPSNQTNPNNPAPAGVYAYTQHQLTVKAIEEKCRMKITILSQDRLKDPVEDVLVQIPRGGDIVLYAVLPIDKALELRQAEPYITLRLLQLDGKTIEKLTGKPYDPKADYPIDIIMLALKTIEIKGGSIRYLTFDELSAELRGKRVAVFNDVLREALQRMIDATFVKSCDSGDCVEINPLGMKSGIRISFPGTVGRLTVEQMSEMIRRGEARIYHVDIEAREVPLCGHE
jgi:hypothetical protein